MRHSEPVATGPVEAAGVAVPESMQGRSLVPLLGDAPAEDWRDAIYYHYYEGEDATHRVHRPEGIRTERYKLIHYYLIDEWELFDLESDPDELRSVYDDPEYSQVRAQLESRLTELRAEYEVPGVDPVPIEGE